MGKFTVGNVVLVTFPFSNLKGQKIRPAMVVAHVEFDNLILCQITSKSYTNKTAVKLDSSDFYQGGLPVVSFVRPDKLFTADQTIIKSIVGTVTKEKKQEILNKVRNIF